LARFLLFSIATLLATAISLFAQPIQSTSVVTPTPFVTALLYYAADAHVVTELKLTPEQAKKLFDSQQKFLSKLAYTTLSRTDEARAKATEAAFEATISDCKARTGLVRHLPSGLRLRNESP